VIGAVEADALEMDDGMSERWNTALAWKNRS